MESRPGDLNTPSSHFACCGVVVSILRKARLAVICRDRILYGLGVRSDNLSACTKSCVVLVVLIDSFHCPDGFILFLFFLNPNLYTAARATKVQRRSRDK